MTGTNKNILLMKANTKILAIDPHKIMEAISLYFDGRGLVEPSVEDAFLWTDTEMTEAKLLWLAKKSWVRNHPEDVEPFSSERFAEELGDVIYMAMITGLRAGVNPFAALLEKMHKKIVKEVEKEKENDK